MTGYWIYDWSPDGRDFIFGLMKTQLDRWVLTRGKGAARPLVTSSHNDHSARISSDGRWLAFVSDETGRDEVYVQPFRGRGVKTQISIDGGVQPVWARDVANFIFARTATK
jgi:eukaryotic-like serine/threonine-protein kinase